MELVNLFWLAGGLVGGTFLGVLLGRRSTTANAYVDKIRAEAAELRVKLRAAEAKGKKGE